MTPYLSRNLVAMVCGALLLLLSAVIMFLCLIQSWSAQQHALMSSLKSLGEGIRHEVYTSLQPLNRDFSDGRCSADLIEAMRQADFNAKYLTYFSLIEDGQVVCTSYEGALRRPLPLQKADVVLPMQASMIHDMAVPLFAGKTRGRAVRVGRFLVFLDYPIESFSNLPPWLKFAGVSVYQGRFNKIVGNLEFRPRQLCGDGEVKHWYEQGRWLLGDCRSPFVCDLVVVDILSYFQHNRWSLVVVLLGASAALMLGLVGGGLLHDRCYGLPRQIRRGLNEHQIQLHYQPVMASDDDRVVGCEVLCRWCGADGIQVPPDRFIPIVEREGLGARLTEVVTRKAIAELRRTGLLGRLRVAINAFPDDIASGHMERLLVRALSPAHYSWVTVELTEQRIDDLQHLGIQVQRLRGLGFKVSIDDFGTGFSNLDTLQSLRVDQLKIDRTFVFGVESPSLKRSLVEHICHLASTLGLKLVAEGVETEEQLGYLKSLGIPFTQGYLHSRPVPLQAFAAFVHDRGVAGECRDNCAATIAMSGELSPKCE